MIDTQLWVYRKKIPVKNKYQNSLDFQNAMKLHQNAVKFFKNLPNDTLIYLTLHQIGELFHAFAFRGLRTPINQTRQFIHDLMNSKSARVLPISDKDLREAIDLSAKSNIHLWDYLCVIPLKSYISTIYTTDIHFRDESFRQFDIPIENPLSSWEDL